MSTKAITVLMLGPSLDVKGGMTSVETLILETPINNVEIQHIPIFQDGYIGSKLTIYFAAIVKTIWAVLTQPVSSIHLHMSNGGSILRGAILILLMSIFRKPVILHMHGSSFHLYFDKFPKFLQSLLRFVFRKCRFIIALSESWKTYYVENLGVEPDRVIILPNPVKLPETLPKRDEARDITFLFLGRLGQRKGTFDLIQAYSALSPDRLAKSSLVLAGDGEIDKAKQNVLELNLGDRVDITGWVGPEQRDRLLSEADIFILPSYNEGLPMAVLEAMGWGLAVITTPVGGIPELVTPNVDGILVEPGNVEQLSTAMDLLVDDAAIRHELGTQARNRVEPLSINSYIDKLANLYQSSQFA
ncbi:MAG: glycosyltransferase family 4 protein [Synechococcus sp.]